MIKRDVQIDQTQAAELIREMIDRAPWKDQIWARTALMIAARAIERGRHTTAKERLDNLRRALLETSAEEPIS